MSAKRIAIAGSTGSIGVSALSVVDEHRDRLVVVGLAAGGNVELLAEQVRAHRPLLVSVRTDEARAALRERLGPDCPEVMVGMEGAEAVASLPESDLFLSAVVGAAGIRPAFRAVASGKQLALANKESLVAAGEAITRQAAERDVSILPVDSEHSALHQCLRGSRPGEVRRVILTASGGPFRKTLAKDMAAVTPEEALRHPTWEMGPKITIDSATLMNKGLEVIEARWLFGLQPERIDVLVHPQSTIHSIVEFTDGSMLAQLGETDMRHPIRYALSYPERWGASGPGLDLTRVGKLEFEAVDRGRFPCLGLAYQALRAGGTAPAVMNAANEVAVGAFLDRRIGFAQIPEIIARTLERCRSGSAETIERVLEADSDARSVAAGFLRSEVAG
jgi:1-deoxy-D-xylulose-5-phosphate reductoisomerase